MSDLVKVCPECGVDMSKLDPYAHSLVHYPDYLDPAKSSKESRKRQAQIQAGGVTVEVYKKLHEEV